MSETIGVHIKKFKNGTFKKTIKNGEATLRTYWRCPSNLQFKSKMVNDMNQHYCGGWGVNNIIDQSDKACFMRVMNGLKPLAILNQYDGLIELIDHTKFDHKIVKRSNGYSYLAVAPKEPIEELFDMPTLMQDYFDNGMFFTFEEFAKHPIKDFFEGWDVEDLGVPKTGLILGYPIENSISILSH